MKSEKTYCQLPIDQIAFPNRARSKVDRERFNGFQATVHEHGVQVPIEVMPAEPGSPTAFDGIDGFVRWLSAKNAGDEKIPVCIRERRLADGERLELEILLNTQRFEWKPTEKARKLHEYLHATQFSQTQAVVRTGWSGTAISNILKLLDLSPAEQADVDAGRIAENTAVVLSQVKDDVQRAELWQRAVNKDLTRDQAVCAAKIFKANSPAAPPSSKGANTPRASAKLGQALTYRGTERTLDAVIDCLQRVLAEARKARRQGLDLPALSKRLQAETLAEVLS